MIHGDRACNTLYSIHVRRDQVEKCLSHTIPPFECRPSGFGYGENFDEALHVVFGNAVDIKGVPISVEHEDNVSSIAFRATPNPGGRVRSGRKHAGNVGARTPSRPSI